MPHTWKKVAAEFGYDPKPGHYNFSNEAIQKLAKEVIRLRKLLEKYEEKKDAVC